MVPILRPCCLANGIRSGRRAISPSSLRISQITAAGVTPGQLRQVATGFGMAGAHQHAAGLRAQREDVAGLHDVGRLGILGRRDLDGARTVGGRDAGGHAGRRLDGHGEVGRQRQAVVAHHQRQVELLAMLLRQRQADQAAAVLGHEVDLFRRDEFGGEQQVALVLAVFFIHQHDHTPGAYLVDDFGYRCNICHLCAALLRFGDSAREGDFIIFGDIPCSLIRHVIAECGYFASAVSMRST